MLQSWLALGLDPRKVAVVEPQPSAEVRALAKSGLALNPAMESRRSAAIVLAVKPQIAAEAMPEVGPRRRQRHLVVSIMAGTHAGLSGARAAEGARSCARCRTRRHRSAAASPWRCRTANVTAAQKARADALLAATGAVEWVADEGLIDAVTAVSGSGPAYVFLLAEALARAGVAAGTAAGACRTSWRARPSPARASCCIARRSMPPHCGKMSRHLAAPPPRRSTS